MAKMPRPAQPSQPAQPASPASAPPKSLILLLIASRKGHYFWSKMGSRGPSPTMPSDPKRPILAPLLDQFNRGTSSKAILRRL